MSGFSEAAKAIEDRLSAAWTLTPIAFENDGEPAATDGAGRRVPWVLCEVLTTDSRIKSIGRPGDHVTVTDGLVALTLFVPKGSGRIIARSYADQLAAIYRTALFHEVAPGGCVRTWTPVIGPGNPARSENPAGSWWAVTITTPFEFYHRA